MVVKKIISGSIIGLIMAAVVGIMSVPALGYVLKTPQLLDLAVKKLGKLSSLEVKQKLVYLNAGEEGGSVEFDETVWYLFPDSFRSDITGTSAGKVHIVSGDSVLTVVNESVVSESENGFDHYKDLLLLRNRILLRQRLVSLGINTEKTRLERYNGSLVFVIGDDDDHYSASPKLYIDKDTFLPVMWVLNPGDDYKGIDRLEVRYHKWKRVKRSYYPTKIQFVKNGRVVREVRVLKLTLNPVLDKALFDTEAAKSEYAGKKKTDTPPPENGGGNDVRDKIDNLDDIIKKDPLAF